MAEQTQSVLIVEDDAATRTLMVRTLQREGWECHVATSIGEALDRLGSSAAPDLLLLDYALPDGNPWAILDRVTTGSPRIPVIVATGMGDESIATECLKRGAVDYIMKGGQFWDLLPRAAERALQIRADQVDARLLTALVRSSPFPVISTDCAGIIRTWNPAATWLYGHRSEAVLGRHMRLLAPEEEQERLQQQFEQALAGRRSRARSQRLTASGETLPVLSGLAPVHDDQNLLIGIAITDQDHRPQREAARLQRLTDELTRVNQELDQFAAVAAHDLQSPLRMASLTFDQLQEQLGDRADETDRELLDMGLEALARCRDMVTRILGYARQASADISQDRDIDCLAACRAALVDLAPQIDETGARVTMADLPTVRFEEGQLVRVLQNIIGNAIKYRHPDRTPEISISSAPADQSGQVAVAIADNGRGIDAEALGSLFSLFSRANQSEDAEGHGIGLAVCKRLVEARGGTMTCQSEPGAGSTFTLHLPLAVSEGSGAHPIQIESGSFGQRHADL